MWVDGATWPENPGYGGVGIVLALRDGGSGEIARPLNGICTNNMAEYAALIVGAQKAKEYGSRVVIYSDSMLVVNQTKGRWRVKEPKLLGFRDRAQEALAVFDEWTLDWLPREENERADVLSKDAAMKAYERARTGGER